MLAGIAVAGCSAAATRITTTASVPSMPSLSPWSMRTNYTQQPEPRRYVQPEPERRTHRPIVSDRRRLRVGKPYQIAGRTYVPRHDPHYNRVGVASWYAKGFVGKPTASGEIYDAGAMTAAHPTLPLNAVVRVTNLANGRSVTVRINDRGPFVKNRIIDLSQRAAEDLGFAHLGLTRVRVQVIRTASASRWRWW
ncbi:MAG: septal ring lytic transglycosylase RlpA family protein [Hyphomicrobiaceae bacterium]|nr:septal ring lytic transglycosylase RlpA family protein [Hyphomicrobiaceae bacterium]